MTFHHHLVTFIGGPANLQQWALPPDQVKDVLYVPVLESMSAAYAETVSGIPDSTRDISFKKAVYHLRPSIGRATPNNWAAFFDGEQRA